MSLCDSQAGGETEGRARPERHWNGVVEKGLPQTLLLLHRSHSSQVLLLLPETSPVLGWQAACHSYYVAKGTLCQFIDLDLHFTNSSQYGLKISLDT